MTPPVQLGPRRIVRTSGANIPNVHVYICEGCQGWNNGKKPTQCNGCGSLAFIHFASKAEAKRYGELMLEQRAGVISDLELQPLFPLYVYHWDAGLSGGVVKDELIKIGAYRGDFQYARDGKAILEDVKGGADTPLSAWKRKHAEAQYGIKIEIVKR